MRTIPAPPPLPRRSQIEVVVRPDGGLRATIPMPLAFRLFGVILCVVVCPIGCVIGLNVVPTATELFGKIGGFGIVALVGVLALLGLGGIVFCLIGPKTVIDYDGAVLRLGRSRWAREDVGNVTIDPLPIPLPGYGQLLFHPKATSSRILPRAAGRGRRAELEAVAAQLREAIGSPDAPIHKMRAL